MAATRSTVDDKKEKKRTEQAREKLHQTAMEQFRLASEAQAPQRKREEEDAKFDAGEHWDPELLKSRGPQMDPSTGKNLPGRPSLTIPKLDQPIQQVINQQRNANLAIMVKPKAAGATQQQAEKINGLIRHIQVESRAQVARGWAYERAVKVGRGYYRILKDWANDGDWDIDLIVDRILNQSAVYIDPFHSQPDASDMEWAFLVEDIPYKRFKREHPKSKLSTSDKDTLRSIGDESPGWVTYGTEGEAKTIRRAEYWYVVYEEKTLIQTAKWSGLEDADDKPKNLGEIINRRTVRQRKVQWAKMTATEILKEEDWEGRYIPIIQVIGREYNVNGERIYKGMISNGKDAQRSYNYMRSKEVEAVGLAPIAPYTMVEGQDEEYEDMWATANTVPYARLIYKPITIAGQQAPPPQRTNVDTNIQAIILAARHADEDLKSVTGFSDPSLGKSNPADRSGRAITALQNRSEAGTSDYLDNLTTVSMVHEGRILLDLLPHVYDREGRVATILDEDLQTSHQIMLNAPYRVQPDGTPKKVGKGAAGSELVDLKKGVYRVVVSVAKSFKTQREESVAMLGELIAATNGQAAPLLTDVLVKNIDAPGFDKLAKRFEAMLPPNILKMEAAAGGLPTQAVAAISALEQQLQQQGQQMQQMGQALQQNQAEAQAKAELEQFKLERQMEIERAKLEMEERLAMEKLRIEEMKIATGSQDKRYTAELQGVVQRTAQETQLRADAIESDTQMQHEAAQNDAERAVKLLSTKEKKP